MSTCPDFNLYSVYLDNELNGTHSQAFSDHLKECPICRKRYSRIKNIRDAFQQDSRFIDLSQKDTEDSFKRLCVIMNYKAVTKKADTPLSFKTLKILSPALAAAFLFALILPLRLSTVNDIPHTIFPQQSNFDVSLINNKGVIADKTLSSVFGNSNRLQKVSSLDFSNTSISSIDVFKPSLSSDTITIQIKLTGFQEILPYTASGLHTAAFAATPGKQF